MSVPPASIAPLPSPTSPAAPGQSIPIITTYGDGSFESPDQLLNPSIKYPLKTSGQTRTYASYNQQPVPELTNQDHGSWNLCLSIPVPDQLVKPTLLSLVYAIKYATTWDNGSSTVQTDVILTDKQAPHGVSFDSNGLGLYRKASGYGPRLIDEDKAVPL